MITHDYRKEIGLEPATRQLPWPLALLILAAAAFLVWFVVMNR